MAQNFQSSFIPKESMTEQGGIKSKNTSILGILAVSLFVLSIVVAAGMFVYKGMLKSEITNLQSDLAQAEGSIDVKTIDEMSQFSKKLDIVKSVVYKHQVVSSFLAVLASSTVSTVHFTEFDYGNLEAGKLSVALKGEAASYSSIALQENILSQNKYFKSISFSNLNLTPEGSISFDLDLSVDPQISAYSPAYVSTPAVYVAPASSTASTTSKTASTTLIKKI